MPKDLFAILAASRPPALFFPGLLLFHTFPLHFPITLHMDAGFGRFSKESRLNLNGNVAWFLMEIISPITLLLTLNLTTHRALSPENKILATMYTIHYLHRAVVSPLLLSPQRSPQHITVTIASILFNLFNGSMVACGLAYFPTYISVHETRFWLGVVGWAIGFAGNIYHDEVLNDLRRPAGQRLVSSLSKEEEEGDKAAGNGRYLIPRAGLFKYISFPNYLCEWFEWTCFALISSPIPFIPVPTLQSIRLSPRLALWIARLGYWPPVLIAPEWLFVVNEVAAMVPRAIRAQGWYRETFGERFPRDRKIVIPGVF